MSASGGFRILEPSDATILEIAELAAASGVALIERDGRAALCGVPNIPQGWRRVSVGVKPVRAVK